jgi:hypothetical protein
VRFRGVELVQSSLSPGRRLGHVRCRGMLRVWVDYDRSPLMPAAVLVHLTLRARPRARRAVVLRSPAPRRPRPPPLPLIERKGLLGVLLGRAEPTPRLVSYARSTAMLNDDAVAKDLRLALLVTLPDDLHDLRASWFDGTRR